MKMYEWKNYKDIRKKQESFQKTSDGQEETLAGRTQAAGANEKKETLAEHRQTVPVTEYLWQRMEQAGKSGGTMRITVYGAEGVIGQKVINYALEQGALVTAYICDAGILWPRKNLTVIEGGLQNKEKIMEAMLEADIIISALTGEGMERKGSDTPLADVHAIIISAMEQLGKTRLVALGSSCIQAFGDQQGLLLRMHPKIASLLYAERVKDFMRTGQVVLRSKLNWTLVRVVDIRAKDDGKGYGVSLDGSNCGFWVSGDNLARFLYEAALEKEKFNRKMPIVYNKT